MSWNVHSREGVGAPLRWVRRVQAGLVWLRSRFFFVRRRLLGDPICGAGCKSFLILPQGNHSIGCTSGGLPLLDTAQQYRETKTSHMIQHVFWTTSTYVNRKTRGTVLSYVRRLRMTSDSMRGDSIVVAHQKACMGNSTLREKFVRMDLEK